MTTTRHRRPTPEDAVAAGPTPPGAPAVTRSRRPGWRNPRLLLGLLLVAASVVGGARVLAGADDTVAVWTSTRDLPDGATLAEADLGRERIRFPDQEAADGYLSADEPAPVGAVLDRRVGAGELLPRAAVAPREQAELVELPLGVASDDLPATVRQGSVVDVWVAPATPGGTGGTTGSGDEPAPEARRVLEDVTVVAVPGTQDSLAPETTRQVILGVPTERSDDVATALGALADGRVVVTRKG